MNARSHFDMISGYLQNAHEVQAGLLYGKPCLMLNAQPFAAYQPDAMAFRMHGRSLAQAQKLADVRGWDPLHADRSAPGWVLVPATHAVRWDRLALEALRCAREASERRVSYAAEPTAPVVEEAPRSQPEDLAQRSSAALAAGFGGMRLSRG